MIESIAESAIHMNATRMAVEYSMAVADNALEVQETAAQGLLQMLPPTPPVVAENQHLIDLYA